MSAMIRLRLDILGTQLRRRLETGAHRRALEDAMHNHLCVCVCVCGSVCSEIPQSPPSSRHTIPHLAHGSLAGAAAADTTFGHVHENVHIRTANTHIHIHTAEESQHSVSLPHTCGTPRSTGDVTT